MQVWSHHFWCFLQEAIKRQKTNQEQVISTEMSFLKFIFFLHFVDRFLLSHFLHLFLRLSLSFLLYFVSTARTRITTPPQDQSVIKGTKAIMNCGVTHDPSVTVK